MNRYLYDNQAIAFVNRIYHAVTHRTIDEYANLPFPPLVVGHLWMLADYYMEYDGEIDDNTAAGKLLNEAYAYMLEAFASERTPGHAMAPYEMASENRYHDARDIYLAFEEPFYLAIVTTNAIFALENAALNIWSHPDALETINNEFQHDRDELHQKVNDALREDRMFANWLDTRPGGDFHIE